MVNNPAPTTSVFRGTEGSGQSSSNNYIAYCFAEKKGFSKSLVLIQVQNADGAFCLYWF